MIKEDAPISAITQYEVIGYRCSLGMTQEMFACAFEIPLGTLRRWEQGVSNPSVSVGKLNLINAVVDWKKKHKK